MTEETRAKSGRKPNTPSLENVVKAIERGEYDESLQEIVRAVGARREALQEQVMERVRQVFGPDAEVTTPSSASPLDRLFGRTREEKKVNPFERKAQEQADSERAVADATRASADELDEDRVTPDPLENLNAVEARMARGEAVTEIEHRGAIISGLSTSQIAD